jgi:hypothetical protein
MNWINIETRLPPKRNKAYQVLARCVKVYGEGNYQGQHQKTVVQDWVIREWKQNFTHWIEIDEPN